MCVCVFFFFFTIFCGNDEDFVLDAHFCSYSHSINERFFCLLNCLFMDSMIRYDHSGIVLQVLLIFVSHCCHFTSVHSCASNPTILAIHSKINFFVVENSTEMVEVRCLTMKVAVTEAGIKSWVAVYNMSSLLLVLSFAVPGACVFIVYCHIKCCHADKANIFVTGCSDVF